MMWGFASACVISFIPSLCLCVCVWSFVFSLLHIVLSASLFYLCPVYSSVSRPCVLVRPPHAVWETYVCSMCTFACVTLYLCVVWASVSCPTGPGCDLGFHLLSLRLLQPAALRSQPTTQQMSPDTAANTHSHMYTLSYTPCLSLNTHRHIHRLTTCTVYNLTHRHAHTQTHIDTFPAHTHTRRVWTSPNRFCFASYSVTFDPKINIKTQVSPGKHPFSHLCGLHMTDLSQCVCVLTGDVDVTNCGSYHVFNILAKLKWIWCISLLSLL